MKKFMKISLILLLAISLVLTGCSTSGGDDSASGGSKSSGEEKADNGIKLSPPGTFPIVQGDPVELTVLVSGDARIEDMQTNAFTKWYEEKTNVKIKFEVAPQDSISETLNLRLASGDYPDIIMSMGVSRAQEMIYGQQGVFLPLNDLIDKHGFYIKKMFEEKPEYKEVITAPDGNIYGLPEVNECYHCSLSVKMWMYKPWLDKVGMQMPQTTAEFRQVLKAFKEQDPNGNGKPDEIPLAGTTKSWNANVELFVMNSFVNTPPNRLFLDNGKVKVSYNQPGWKEGLKYLNSLYKDGLIAVESFTQDGQQLRQLGENPDIPILGAFAAGWFGIGTEYGGPSGRWKDYTSVPPLAGPDGQRLAVSFPYQIATGKLVITNATKYPEVAMRWADGFFENEEVLPRANGGVKGEDWKEAEPGMKGIDGRPAKRVALTDYGRVQNNQWYQKSPSYTSDDFRLELAAGEKPEENLEVILFNQSRDNYEPYRAKIETVLPPLYFTEEQSTELADLEKTLKDYVDQTIAQFITGELNVESEWDKYLQTLKGMNVDRFIEIYQQAYDAKK
jgi:putative aldouronate transport system substrate-binding protein